MQIKLYNKPDPNIPPKKMVCLNRNIKIQNIHRYLKDTTEYIYPPEAFGKELMDKGVEMLLKHIIANHKVFLIVDCDPDGWTSSALMINYLYELFPAWVQNNLSWGLHEGKQHGLDDFIERLVSSDYSLILVPDAGSNDIKPIERLHNLGIDVLILDHHIAEEISPYAVVINSQYNYPNKELSGVGVVYKFCQYLDKKIDKDVVTKFKDLAATGLMADMMDIRSLETKEMIFEGFKDENLRNPLIRGLADKNDFALHKGDYVPSPDNDLRVTPMGAAFFIIPLINAMSRSGTMEEKNLVFKSMLTMCAFEQIPSNKRGHKLGEMERVLDQALRCTTNVKNRQTRFEDAGMEILDSKAKQQIDNKVFVFVTNDEQIPATIGGLVANKMMAKYQRPVCVVRAASDGSYSGSMRGYTVTGISNFMEVAQSSKYCNWVRGHENAAGISINNIDNFIQDMNEALKDISTEIVYYVDYIYDAAYVEDDTVIALAELNDYLGTGFPRPLIYVENFTLTAETFAVMKSNTLKFVLPCGINVIKFGGTDEEIENIEANFGNIMNLVCKCHINEWNGERNPQLICVDYEIIKNENKNPLECWNF